MTFVAFFREVPASAPALEELRELVSVAVRLDRRRVLRGVRTKLNAVFCLSTGSLVSEKGSATRPPRVELCLCLDRSGSMSGDKLALSKVAIARVLACLSPGDAVSCVGYDNAAEVVFPRTVLSGAEDEEAGLRARVEAIASGGSTNMSQGMEAAAAQLRATGGADCVKRIFLFSDGRATSGLRSAKELGKLAADICAKGICISTFGLGKDYDEDLMQQIAREGHGYFFYCRRAVQIPGFVEEALSQTQRTVGTHASLALVGLSSAVLCKVYNHAEHVAALNDLKQNNSITVACKLAAAPTHQSELAREPVLGWTLSYTNAVTGEREERRGIVEAELTSDPQAAAEPGDAAARACVLQVKASLLDRKVCYFLILPLWLICPR